MKQNYKKRDSLKELLFSMGKKELSQSARRNILLSIAKCEDGEQQIARMTEMVKNHATSEIELIVEELI